MAYLNPRVLNFGQLDFFTAAATSTPKRVAVVNFPGAGNYAYVMGGAVGAIP